MRAGTGMVGTRFGWAAIAAASLAMLAGPASAEAAKYVDDGATGALCTEVAPCGTVQEGVNAAADGETVFVDGGTYGENVSLGEDKSLIAMEFAGPPEGPPVIDGGPNTAIAVDQPLGAGLIQGFTIQADMFGIFLDSPATVTGNTFDETVDGSTMVVADSIAGGSVISGNTFTGNPSATVDQLGVNPTGGPLVTISDNEFNDLSVAIIVGGDGADGMISGNTIAGTHPGNTFDGTGIDIRDDANPTVVGNLIHLPGAGATHGISVLEGGAAAPTGATLRRNRILAGFTTGVSVTETTGPVTLDSDLIVGADFGGLGANDAGVTTAAGEGDVSATNITVVGSGPDIDLLNTELTLDSSISEDFVNAIGDSNCTISFSNGPGTTPGGDGCQNFQTNADPMLTADFHLMPGSPMIDTGNHFVTPPPGALDVDGDARALSGVPACTPSAGDRDIGADEFVPAIPSSCNPPPAAIPGIPPVATPPTAKKCRKGRKLKKGKCVKKKRKKR